MKFPKIFPSFHRPKHFVQQLKMIRQTIYNITVSFPVVVVVTFFICWAPHHAQRLLAVYGNNGQKTSDDFNYIFDYLTYASGILYFTSTCINPFLYSLMSYKFREAFKVSVSFVT